MQRSLLFLFAAAAFAGPSFAQGDSTGLEAQLTAARATYGADAWPAGARVDGVPLGTLELKGLRADALRTDGTRVFQTYVGADAPADARAILRLEARVCDDVATAHATLVSWLAAQQSPEPTPRAEAFGARLGEAGYVAPAGAAEGAVSFVAFVRGNVAVRVLNVDLLGSPELDVLGAAKAIDTAIAARPKLELDATPARPDVATLTATATTVAAGASAKLDVLVVDPLGGAATLVWNVGGEGQGYVERRSDGWLLFPTAPGRLEVKLVAISSLGTVAERTLAFDVTPE